jgi:uncharacterized protein YndB with AHSA1/START domain
VASARPGQASGVPTVTTSIDLRAPVNRVWDLVSDPQRLPDWVSIHAGFPDGAPAALEEGTTFKQELRMAGQDVEVTWTVEELKEGESLVWSGEGPMGATARTRYALEDVGDGSTRFDYENTYDLPGGILGKVAGKVAEGGAEGEAETSLEKLKTLVEAEGDTPAPGNAPS